MIGKSIYGLMNVSWNRINNVIQIRKYMDKDIKKMFKGRYFDTKMGFITFVVFLFVNKSEELFATVDSLGLSRKMAPSILMRELYGFCKTCSPILHDMETSGIYYCHTISAERSKIIEINIDKLAGWMMAKGHKGLSNSDDCDDDNWTNDLMDSLEELYRLETTVNRTMLEHRGLIE